MARVHAPAGKIPMWLGGPSMEDLWKHWKKHHGYKHLLVYMVEFGESFTLFSNKVMPNLWNIIGMHV